MTKDTFYKHESSITKNKLRGNTNKGGQSESRNPDEEPRHKNHATNQS